jgi:hypothetical protein
LITKTFETPSFPVILETPWRARPRAYMSRKFSRCSGARIHTGNVCGDMAALREFEPGTEKEGRRNMKGVPGM